MEINFGIKLLWYKVSFTTKLLCGTIWLCTKLLLYQANFGTMSLGTKLLRCKVTLVLINFCTRSPWYHVTILPSSSVS